MEDIKPLKDLTPFEQGYQAFMDLIDRSKNPYYPQSPGAAQEWLLGWQNAKSNMERKYL